MTPRDCFASIRYNQGVFVGTVEFTLLVLLAVILAGPLVAERFRIPGLLGLIFFGMVFGPNVAGWLGRVGLVEDLGSIGILYLMFLAGLSFNLKSFMENRASAVAFGLLGFGIPFVISAWTGVAVLELEVLAALLIGAMWASNTLVAYPEVRAAGLAENRAVRDAVSAGVVADLLSLLVLAVATSQAVIDISNLPEIVQDLVEPPPDFPLWASIPLLVAFCLWVLPRLGEWFFVRVGHSRVQRFLFALAGMAAGAALAVLAGVEGLIGAFLSGLGLNTLVPARSELMDRLDFVGSTVFVPAFLVSIGLSIDPRVFFDFKTLQLGIIFSLLVVVGKSIAVLIAGSLFKLTLDEIGLTASLSFGQAASTLAIAQVGLSLGFFGQDVVNGAILAIVITALATSYGTRLFIRRVPRPVPAPSSIGERIMVDAHRTSSDLDMVMEFAGRIANADVGVLIPFTVPGSGQLESGRNRLTEAEAAAARSGHDAAGTVRVAESFVTGALGLVEENDATLVVLAWSGMRFGGDYVFGTEIDEFGEKSPVPSVAVQMIGPWERVVLVIGNTKVQWHREDAHLAAEIAVRVRPSKESPMLVFGPDPTEIEGEIGELENIEFVKRSFRVRDLVSQIRPDDLVVVPGYVLDDVSLTDQLRLARRLVRNDIAIVAGPNRLSISRAGTPHRMERLIGHG